MIVRNVKSGPIDRYALMVMSDLHIGNSIIDYKRMKADLEYAKDNDAEIAILGDIFDNIVPKDPKKGSVVALHPRLRKSDAVMTEAIEMALDILSPYKDRIVLMAVGNHDDWSIKRAGVDLVQGLLWRLDLPEAYGSIAGWYVRSFDAGQRRSCSIKMRYHHGAGCSAPSTKGMTDFYRMRSWVEGADIIAMGHKHNRFADASQSEYLTSKATVKTRTTLCLMPGSYMPHGVGQTVQEASQHGLMRHYAEDINCGPQTMGGILVECRADKSRVEDGNLRLSVTMPVL